MPNDIDYTRAAHDALDTVFDTERRVVSGMPPESIEAALTRIEPLFESGRFADAQAMLDLIDRTVDLVGDRIGTLGWTALSQEEAPECPDRFEIEELQEVVRHLVQIRSVGTLVAASYAMVGDGSLLGPLPRPDAVKPAPKAYFDAVRDLARPALQSVRDDAPDEPLVNIISPMSTPAMQSVVERFKQRHGIETKTDLWTKIAGRSGRPGSATNDKGGKVRKALGDRLSSPIPKLALENDDLDTTIAKLVLIALVIDENDSWSSKLDAVGDDLYALIDEHGGDPAALVGAVDRLYEERMGSQ